MASKSPTEYKIRYEEIGYPQAMKLFASIRCFTSKDEVCFTKVNSAIFDIPRSKVAALKADGTIRCFADVKYEPGPESRHSSTAFGLARTLVDEGPRPYFTDNMTTMYYDDDMRVEESFELNPFFSSSYSRGRRRVDAQLQNRVLAGREEAVRKGYRKCTSKERVVVASPVQEISPPCAPINQYGLSAQTPELGRGVSVPSKVPSLQNGFQCKGLISDGPVSVSHGMGADECMVNESVRTLAASPVDEHPWHPSMISTSLQAQAE
ncbi:uncharacterized protein B0H64DRAFT_433482 [Chaetomium fimeti]|uniref:Uncharacterized protein n=1 Tax=Chaetomium fimeti TaxID=1854472 RepID=A0AAE0HD68_9PEZI|nr:hypothetical protein B0H64DRAFT_433482 [Chaetomium fimeti]